MPPELIFTRASASQRTRLAGLNGYPQRWFGAAPQPAAQEGNLGHRDTFAAALAQLSSAIRQQGAVDDQHALEVIIQGAVALIPGAQEAAVVVPVRDGQLEPHAIYGQLPPLIITLQNEVGEGPCLEAVTDTSQVLVDDLAEDDRWPMFSAEALRLGVRSMLCTPLAAQDQILGSLSLASSEPRAFNGESMEVAAVFAAHAALAVLGAHQVRGLTAMADTRDLIGQAKGILMERYKLSSTAAFELLLTASQHTNVKLRQVCEHLADTGEFTEPSATARKKH